MKLDNYYYLEYSDYWAHRYWYNHNDSADMKKAERRIGRNAVIITIKIRSIIRIFKVIITWIRKESWISYNNFLNNCSEQLLMRQINFFRKVMTDWFLRHVNPSRVILGLTITFTYLLTSYFLRVFGTEFSGTKYLYLIQIIYI